MHRFQQWYFPLVYSLIAFDFILRDFLMAFFGKSDPNHVYPKMPADEKVTFWLGKIFHFGVMIGLPMLVFPWWQVLIGYVFIQLIVGLLLGIVFQLAHISGDAQFPTPKENPLRIDNEWAAHQVETTVDFAPRNRALNFYIGGLNYQIEHHLLPHICHINYPRLAPIVEQTCREYGLRYVSYPSWRAAFVAHWRQLRALGQKP
jgi:linoleoyl-CoA desaturase